MSEPHPERAAPAAQRWKLRPSVWRQWGEGFFVPLIGGAIAASEGFWLVALGLVAVGSLPFWTLVLRERLRRPPVLEYWDDYREQPLIIRHLRTGDVLLKASVSDLSGASLAGAQLAEANLQHLRLDGADLRRAVLRGADLRDATLLKANLAESDLRGARLDGALVAGADFRGADLRGADFVGRGVRHTGWGHDLHEANLKGARYSRTTRWPWGGDPVAHGCILVEENANLLPIPHAEAAPSQNYLPLPSHHGVSPQ